MSGFTLPTSRPITQAWAAEFDDWDGDGTVDYPGGFYHSIGWDGHNGIDYGCFTGDPVEAVADGVVAFAGDAGYWHAILSGGGNAVLIEHPAYEVQTEYLHLSRWAVAVGQYVTKGQVIGYSGATGAATAPHLHLGMLKLRGYNLNDRWRGRIDPTPWLYGSLNPDYAGAGAIAPQGSITPTEEGFLMALTDAEQKLVLDTIGYIRSAQFKADIFAGTTQVEKDARNKFHQEALNTGVPWFGYDGKQPPEGQRRTTSPAVDLGYADTREMRTTALVSGLQELVKQLSEKQGVTVDYDAIRAASAAGVKDAIESITTTVKLEA